MNEPTLTLDDSKSVFTIARDQTMRTFVICPKHGPDSPEFTISFFLPEGSEKVTTCLRCFRDAVVSHIPIIKQEVTS